MTWCTDMAKRLSSKLLLGLPLVIVLCALGSSACDSQGELSRGENPEGEPSCCEAPSVTLTIPDSLILYVDEESRRVDRSKYIQKTGDNVRILSISQTGTSADVFKVGFTLVLNPKDLGITIVHLNVSTRAGDAVEDSITVDVRPSIFDPLAFLPFREGREWIYEHRTGDVTSDGKW